VSALLRLPLQFGGDPQNVLEVEILNDTGSNVQSILDQDAVALRYSLPQFRSLLGQTWTSLAGGINMQKTTADADCV